MPNGGTWDTQNKKYPGVYIRFRSTGGLPLNVGDRGTVAICEPLSWGPVAQVMEIAALENGKALPVEGGYILLNRGLAVGDKVLMLQVMGGQKFIVLSRLFDREG